MADLKTILRETSVILGLTDSASKSKDPKSYSDFLLDTVQNSHEVISEIRKIQELKDFHGYESILSNGISLGEKILRKTGLNKKISWLGGSVKMEYPFDLLVDGKGISLKEHSYILKNPALSSYVNSLTQITPPFRTIHIFRDFSKENFESWFKYTFGKAFDHGEKEIIFHNKKRNMIFFKERDKIVFQESSGRTKSIWTMNTESAKKIGHPAPFPEELPFRLIQLYSFVDDVILDPFMGSGTTAVAALKSKRKFVGFDNEIKYVDLAEKRILPFRNMIL
jgi:hypothetical protein